MQSTDPLFLQQQPATNSTSSAAVPCPNPDTLPPIGVFDSGIGGLSILRSLLQAIPQRRFVYLADTAYAPYGERGDAYVIERSRTIARWMHDVQHTCGLVIACNTATAAACTTLRNEYGDSWPIVGVEPGIKPAAQLSQTGRIGIMATAGTLNSAKYQTLIRRIHDSTHIPLQLFPCPCDGLAEAIEHHRTELIETLVERYAAQLRALSPDVVVLGCTHYPLIRERIAQALPGIQILDTGAAVARHAQTVFSAGNGAATPPAISETTSETPSLHVWTNETPALLSQALSRWLPDTPAQVHTWSS